MSFRPILPLLAAAAVLLSGCGATEAELPVAADVASVPESRATPGWDAPDPVAGRQLGALSDEFDDPSTLESWGYFEGDYGRNRFMIERNRRGELDVMPSRSAWADGDRGFYLYKQVSGDFDVSMRLRVTGRDGLSGLLVRVSPEEDGDPENWLALRVGASTLERATTFSGRSDRTQHRGRPGWNDLRIVRRADRFTLHRRRPGGAWRRHWTYARPDLPATVQVGIDAFSGYGEAKADLVSHVDWIRFRPAA